MFFDHQMGIQFACIGKSMQRRVHKKMFANIKVYLSYESRLQTLERLLI